MTASTDSTNRSSAPRFAARKGSALILVLIMTLSLAGLAISAIYLSSSAGLLTRYYDRERDYRFAAEAALALGKSRVTNDTSLVLPSDTAMTLLNGASLTDAAGNTIPRIKVNLYAAYTGDTTGRYGQFVTLIAQAYDSGGTRYVRRLDLIAQSFAKYAMFTNISPTNYQYGPGEFLKGRGHSNGDWKSVGAGPGPHYYDTITAVGTVSGAAGNAVYDKGYIAGYKYIPYPSVPKIAQLPGLASAANLELAPVSGVSGGKKQGSRIEFLPIDINENGSYEEGEGFFRVFDLALGRDTVRLRADMNGFGTTSVPVTDSVLNNQCGSFYTIGGKKQFFPVGVHQVAWVTALIQTSTNPVISATTAGKMADRSTASKTQTAVDLILSQPMARCYPAGDPHLLLTERFTDALGTWHGDSLAVATSPDSVPWGQLIVTQRYGGQDTTWTPVARDCVILTSATTGKCTAGSRQRLGVWRVWPGASLTTWPAINSAGLTPKQANEEAYAWPMSSPYNANSHGVIHLTGKKFYMSGVFRGNLTVYADSNLTWIDDLTYDQDPAAPSALCRNLLGIIVGDSAMLADNAINRPRVIDWGGTKIVKFFGSNEDFYLHAILLSLRATVATEQPNDNTALYPTPVSCPTGDSTGTAGTSGGCWFQTGGTIQVTISQNYGSSANSGLRVGRTLDPCQLTNKRPAFFPMSMQYQDNKYYEIDPVNVSTWSQVKLYYSYLRGRPAP
jgi:hypothetical protein